MKATRFRVVTVALESGFDHAQAPAFARTLYRMAQTFMAVVSGFGLTAFLLSTQRIGPVLCVLGAVMMPLGGLLAILAMRLRIESALAVIALRDHIAHHTTAAPLPADHSHGPRIREISRRKD
jgi:hypothetical protein